MQNPRDAAPSSTAGPNLDKLAALVLASMQWGDDSVATGWLMRRAKMLCGVELSVKQAAGLVRAERARRRKGARP